MKRLVFALLTLPLFSPAVFASPLLFKAIKTVDTDTEAMLATFDATRYRQVRLGVQILSADPTECGTTSPSLQAFDLQSQLDSANRELASARREWERNDELLQKGVISRALMDDSNDRLEAAKLAVNVITARIAENKSRPRLRFGCPSLKIFGDGGAEMSALLGEMLGNQPFGRFFVVDSPPDKIRFVAFGKGRYVIYIWGH